MYLLKLTLKDNAYLFNGDILYQGSGGILLTKVYVNDTKITTTGTGEASNIKVVNNFAVAPLINYKIPKISESDLVQAEIVGDVSNDNTVILRSANGEFDKDSYVFATINVSSILLEQSASYTQGAIISLKNIDGIVVATGSVLEETIKQNSVKVKVLTGEFFVDGRYTLKSNILKDTNSSTIISVQSLSTDLTILSIDNNIAITETSQEHGLGVGDDVDITILPDDDSTETTYYVRKKLFQTV